MKLRTILATLAIAVCATAAKADDDGLKIIQSSFKNTEQQMTKDDGMGSMNMLARSIDWDDDDYTDADGKSDVALLLVTFENVSPQEIDKITTKVSNGNGKKLAAKLLEDGVTYVLPVVIPTKENDPKPTDVTFTHGTYGSDRLTGKTFLWHNVYTLKIQNAMRLGIRINSNPEGARVIFDGKYEGVTPLNLQDVKMGPHSLSLEATNNSYKPLAKTVIDVQPEKRFFEYDLRKTTDVTFRSNNKDALLELIDPANGNNKIAQGVGSVAAQNLPYGGYTIKALVNGQYIDPISVTVNDQTPAVQEITVLESKSVSFIAYQNNAEVHAQVDLDGAQIGSAPMTYKVPYGRHQLTMSHSGKHKTKNIKVDLNSPKEYTLILPKIKYSSWHSHWNPFEIDYNKREWSVDFSYVNKQFVHTYKEGGRKYNTPTDHWGEDDKMFHGMQMGIGWRPYFGYGQGLITGIYWQMFMHDMGNSSWWNGDDDPLETEMDLYIPIMYQFRLPLAEDFSIYVAAGFAAQIGITHSLEYYYGENDTETVDIGFGRNEEDGNNLYMPDRCQWYLPLAAGLQWKAVQLEFKYQFGLNNNSALEELWMQYEDVQSSYKARMMEFTLSIAF